MLDELIERFGKGAIVRAWPHMLESGETYRWQLEIDGVNVPGVSAQVRRDLEHDYTRVMVLVGNDEEVELLRWSTRMHPHGPADVVRRLGNLQ